MSSDVGLQTLIKKYTARNLEANDKSKGDTIPDIILA